MGNEEQNKEENKNKQSTDPQPEPVQAAKASAVEATVAKLEMVAAEPAPAQPAAEEEEPALIRAAYEHPLAIRITHWVNAISLFVMVTSGLRIFRAFPSFGPKIPENDLIDIPKALTLGGWLGGALQWHFTFMWFFAASGISYFLYQVLSKPDPDRPAKPPTARPNYQPFDKQNQVFYSRHWLMNHYLCKKVLQFVNPGRNPN